MQAWLEMLSHDNMKTIIPAFVLLGIYLEFELRTRKPNVDLRVLQLGPLIKFSIVRGGQGTFSCPLQLLY